MIDINKRHPNIGIITIPVSDAGVIPLSQLIDICYALSDKLFLITGNKGNKISNSKMKSFCIHYKTLNNTIMRVLNYILLQVHQSYLLAKLWNEVDVWIFFIGGTNLLLPMIIAKLQKKKVLLVFAGSTVETLIAKNDRKLIIVKILERLTCHLSDRIILYSDGHLSEWNLGKFKNKIIISHRHFINFYLFSLNNEIEKRDNLIGYVGRLNPEKGVMNFVKSLNMIKEKINYKYIIIGDGPLRGALCNYCREKGLDDIVQFTGWIPHDDLPIYLNKLKILVLPSYTEGLPNIIIESMSCGTPVLASQVGAIPHIILDGKTGFLMESNSPDCIASNIIRALKHPDLVGIAKCAQTLVESEFTFDKALERWGKILEEMCNDV